MRGMIPIASLIGDAEPLVPAEMQFHAVLAVNWMPRHSKTPERACRQCIFDGQRAKVCIQTTALARLAGMPDCEERDVETDKTFIYKLNAPQDERQLSILEEL